MICHLAAVPAAAAAAAAAGGAITLTWLTRANIPWSGAHTKYFSPLSVPLCRPFGTCSGKKVGSWSESGVEVDQKEWAGRNRISATPRSR